MNRDTSSLPVDPDSHDTFYRYRMPCVQGKYESGGNGAKTALPNLGDVARALDRPVTWLHRFLGTDLGIKPVLNDGGRVFIIMGHHRVDDLQLCVNRFIRAFVLCTKCRNPETTLSAKNTKLNIHQRCRACGWHGALPTTHKLSNYVRTQLVAAASHDAEDNNHPATSHHQAPDDKATEDDAWVVDTSVEAIAARQAACGLSAAAQQLVGTNAGAAETLTERLCHVQYAVTTSSSAQLRALVAHLHVVAEAGTVIVALLDDARAAGQSGLHTLQQLRSAIDALLVQQPAAQRAFLRAYTKMVAAEPLVRHELCAVLQFMYLEDWLDDDVLQQWRLSSWARATSKSANLADTAQAFWEWLDNTQEEEEEDDAQHEEKQEEEEHEEQQEDVEDDSDETLDIDAI
jgi:translation initiation factor 5